MKYTYFELKQDAGKPYILANESEKPLFKYGSINKFATLYEEWQSKHVHIEFASQLEENKTFIYLELNTDMNAKEIEVLSKTKGIPLKCVEVKCIGCENNKKIDEKYLACYRCKKYKFRYWTRILKNK